MDVGIDCESAQRGVFTGQNGFTWLLQKGKFINAPSVYVGQKFPRDDGVLKI